MFKPLCSTESRSEVRTDTVYSSGKKYIFIYIVIYFWFGVVWAAIMGAGSIARIINIIFLLDLIKNIKYT